MEISHTAVQVEGEKRFGLEPTKSSRRRKMRNLYVACTLASLCGFITLLWTAWKLFVLVPNVKLYVIVMQLTAVLTNTLDMMLSKRQTVKTRRVPEDVFHLLTVMGASLPNLLSVLVCGHKRTEAAYLKHFLIVCIFQELVVIMTYFAFAM